MSPTARSSARARAPAAARVLVVDDHPIVRRGIAQLLAHEPGLAVCGEAEGAPEALALVERLRPDLVLLDLSLKNSSGLELLKSLHKSRPRLRVLVVSMHDEILYAERALRAGARGYVTKDAAPGVLVEAIRRVLEGGVHVSPRVAERFLRQCTGRGRPAAGAYGIERLSDRELELFELLGAGLSTREAARRLGLSVKTVETHRAHIKEKLGLRNGTELLHLAIRWNERPRGDGGAAAAGGPARA